MVSWPVITVDGPGGAGKGTLSRVLAAHFGWHFLDSGALYRITAYACLQSGVDWADEPAVAQVSRVLDTRFVMRPDGEVGVLYAGRDVSSAIRSEEGGRGASVVAALPSVRAALLERQRDFRSAPGLVADGRDMGTVVFPDAPLKIFLTASAEERARRRYEQLRGKGESVSLPRLLEDIKERDARDSGRAVAPLLAARDAVIIDSTATPAEAVFKAVLLEASRRGIST